MLVTFNNIFKLISLVPSMSYRIRCFIYFESFEIDINIPTANECHNLIDIYTSRVEIFQNTDKKCKECLF